jgi:hypothetical protein
VIALHEFEPIRTHLTIQLALQENRKFVETGSDGRPCRRIPFVTAPTKSVYDSQLNDACTNCLWKLTFRRYVPNDGGGGGAKIRDVHRPHAHHFLSISLLFCLFVAFFLIFFLLYRFPVLFSSCMSLAPFSCGSFLSYFFLAHSLFRSAWSNWRSPGHIRPDTTYNHSGEIICYFVTIY